MLASLRETTWGVVAEASGASALSPSEARDYTDRNYARLLACARRLLARVAEPASEGRGRTEGHDAAAAELERALQMLLAS